METELRDLFNAALVAFAAGRAEDGGDLPILFANRPPPAGLNAAPAYLALATLPAEPERLFVDGGEASYLWLLQVGIYVRDGEGEDPALAVVDALRAAFPSEHELAGTDITYRVTDPAAVRRPLPANGWQHFPALLRLQAFA